jgi:integrase
MIRVMEITGWRSWSEIASRRRSHVDWKAGELILEAGEAKNSEPRISADW